MSKYIALLIDTLNHDASISHLLNPTERINKVVNAYKKSIIRNNYNSIIKAMP